MFDERVPSAHESMPRTMPMRGWWVVALCALAGAYGVVVLVVAGTRAAGNWIEAPPSIVLNGAAFNVVRGSGHQDGTGLVVDAVDRAGVAAVSAAVPEFVAERYARVEWQVRTSGRAPPEIAFVWRNREQPGVTLFKRLEWVDGRVAPVELDERDRWAGSIVGLGLIIRGDLSAPVVIESVSVPGVWVGSAARDILAQWSAHLPFAGHSITFPFDRERSEPLSLLATTVIAIALAIAFCWLFAHRRARPLDRRMIWTVFLVGWLVLDARWQVNLWRQLADTFASFAGRSTDEKHLAADDRELYGLMRQVSEALPASPVRIIFLSDSYPLRVRGAFFLYPHNVNALYQDTPRTARGPDPDDLHEGDYVLLFLYRGLRYDRERKLLLWADGAHKAADEVLWKDDGVMLLRMR